MKKILFVVLLLLFAFGGETIAKRDPIPVTKDKRLLASNDNVLSIAQDNKTGLYGLRDLMAWKWVIQPLYSNLSMFTELVDDNRAYIVAEYENNKYGVIDPEGKLVIPFNKYKRIYPHILPDFLFIAKDWNNKYGVIDTSGRTICPFIYDEIKIPGREHEITWPDFNYLLIAERSGKWGLINFNGNPITEFIYKNVFYASPYIASPPKTSLIFEGKDYVFYVDSHFNVLEYNRINHSQSASNQHSNSYTTNTPKKSTNSTIKTATAIGVFIGLAACIIDAISSSSSSSSSSYSSSSSSSSRSSYSSSSSSRSKSVCSECTGRGMMNCPWCYGSGIRKGGWFEADETCISCKGKGQIWCYHCSGRGSR